MKRKGMKPIFWLVLGATAIVTAPFDAGTDGTVAETPINRINNKLGTLEVPGKCQIRFTTDGTPTMGVTGCSDPGHEHKQHFFVSGDEEGYYGGYIYNESDGRYFLIGEESLDPENVVAMEKGFYVADSYADLVARSQAGTMSEVACSTFEQQVISTVQVEAIDAEYTSAPQALVSLWEGSDVASLNLRYINDVAGRNNLSDLKYQVSSDNGASYTEWSSEIPQATMPGEYKVRIKKGDLDYVEILDNEIFEVTAVINRMKIKATGDLTFFYSNYDFILDLPDTFPAAVSYVVRKDGQIVTSMKEVGDYTITLTLSDPALYTWDDGETGEKVINATVEKVLNHAWYEEEDEMIDEPTLFNGYLCSADHPLNAEFGYVPHLMVHSYNSKRAYFDATSLFPDPEYMDMTRENVPTMFFSNWKEIVSNQWYNQWLYAHGEDRYGNFIMKPCDGIYRASVAQLLKPIPNELVYNGQEQTLVQPAQVLEGMTALYSLDLSNWSAELPTGKAAGEYNVYFKALGDGVNIADGVANEDNYVTVVIASDEVPVPTSFELQYSAVTKDLNSLVKNRYYNVYCNGKLITSASEIAGLEPGRYELVIELKDKEGSHWAGTDYDHKDHVIFVEIHKLSTYQWGDEAGIVQHPYCPNESSNKHLKYVAKEGFECKFVDMDGNEETYHEDRIEDVTALEHAGVGEWFEIVSHTEGMYKLHHCKVEYTSAGGLVAPTAKELSYIAKEQKLVNPGQVIDGMVMEYSLDGTEWSTEVPVAKEVGDYKVFYRVLGNDYYEGIPYDPSRFASVRIDEFSIASWEALNELIDYSIPENVTYDGLGHFASASVKDGLDLFSNEVISLVYIKDGQDEPTETPIDAGTYHVFIVFDGGFDVYDDMIELGQMVIAPKAVTVTVKDETKAVCEENPTFTYTVTGLVDGDTLTGITVTCDGGSEIGTYDIVASESNPGSNGNYVITFVKGTLTVTDHHFDKGEVTERPSCTEEGVRTHHCTVEGCDATRTSKIATFPFHVFAIILLVLFVAYEIVWFFVFKARSLDLINFLVTSGYAVVSLIFAVIGLARGGCGACAAFMFVNTIAAFLALAFYLFIWKLIGGNTPKEGEKAVEEVTEAVSLAESLKIAEEVSEAGIVSKKTINEYLAKTHKGDVEINARANYVSNGKLMLADTYYTLKKSVDGKKVHTKKSCFGYVYENAEGGVMALVKIPSSYAKTLIKEHKYVTLSKFPKTHDGSTWYSVPVDHTWNSASLNKMLSDVVEINEGKAAE